MCYAIPGKIESINAKMVTVDYFGEKKKALNELTGLSVGDYVYAQGGYLISKVPQQQAEESLSIWKDLFFSLKELDNRLAQYPNDKKDSQSRSAKIFRKVTQAQDPSVDELGYLLSLTEKNELEEFFKFSNSLRKSYLSNSCCVHGIIEISNYCQRQCSYCGISTQNKNLKRYKMTKEEIIQSVEEAVNIYGFKALVLQSGESDAYGIEELVEIISQIKKRFAVLIFISFGEIGKEGLAKLYQAGARGLLMRFETSNPDLYEKLHPGASLDERLLQIDYAYNLGYLIITGALIGLPGQTGQDIINDIRLARKLHAEMFSFGPFIRHPETPLAKAVESKEEDILKVLALCRLLADAQTKILVTTGFESISNQAREKGLACGGNSVMLNITPLKFRRLYNIYPNRAHEQETIETQIKDVLDLLKSMGRAPTDLGVSV
ncbi:MAG: radical SAM protein [Candidatus Omnitrophota bacterium]